MLIYIQIIQMLAMVGLFYVIHIVLDTKAPKFCEVKQKGSGAEAQKRRSKSEKLRIFLIVLIGPTLVTIFTIWFFYIIPALYYNQDPTLYYVIEISSSILGGSGAIFVAYPTSKIAVTYWDQLHKGGELKKKLLENRGTVLNAEFGLTLIFYGFVIKLIFLLNQNIF